MRKLKFDNPEELEEKITRYFETLRPPGQELKWKPPTLSGLALFLGTTRFTLCDYMNSVKTGGSGTKAQCGELLLMAKAQIECYLEEELVARTGSTRGIEFALQNGYEGWGAKKDVKVEAEVEQKTDAKAITLTDEELMHQLAVLTAKTMEIMKKEGAAGGTDGR